MLEDRNALVPDYGSKLAVRKADVIVNESISFLRIFKRLQISFYFALRCFLDKYNPIFDSKKP